MGDEELEDLRATLATIMKSNPFDRYGIHAVGIGRKLIRGQPTEITALRFYVAEKLPAEDLGSRMIPRSFQNAGPGRTVRQLLPTDVIPEPPPSLLTENVDLGSAIRPVPGGVSVSAHSWYGAGTMGGWVWDRTDGTLVMLSNWHVFGDAAGDPIIQPGRADGGQHPEHRIGRVKRGFRPVPASDPAHPSDCNYIDAAIGEPDSATLADLSVVLIGPAVLAIRPAHRGLQVEKTGQTTGHTPRGVVTDVDCNVQMDFPEVGSAVICDCIRVEPVDPSWVWSSQGDSGSIVFADNETNGLKTAVGLLFAGGAIPPNNYGLACRIERVFSQLNLGPIGSSRMARVADYQTIMDGRFEFFNEAHVLVRDFSVPSNYVDTNRTVLFFAVQKDPAVKFNLRVFINGAHHGASPVWEGYFQDSIRYYSVNEILEPATLRAGQNAIVMAITNSDFNGGHIFITDIFVMFQVDNSV